MRVIDSASAMNLVDALCYTRPYTSTQKASRQCLKTSKSPYPPTNLQHGRGKGQFLADAPPARVVELAESLKSNNLSSAEVKQAGLRNAANVLVSLGLAVSTADGLVAATHLAEQSATKVVRASVGEMPTFREALEALTESPSLSRIEIASKIESTGFFNWSSASKKRIGGAMRGWVEWYQL